MDDLISRQAAIAEFSCCELTPDGGIDVNYAIDFLEQLPSVQPQSTMGQVNEAVQSTNDCISRQAAIDALGDMVMNWTDSDYELGQLNQWKEDRKAIIDLPSAQQERMRGRWVPVTNGRGGYECDQCHNYAPSYQDGVEWLSDFCPNCGADMRGEQDE